MVLTKSAVPKIAAVVLLALTLFWLRIFPIPSADASSIVLSKIYTNTAYGFTLQMPEDFAGYPPDGSPDRDENGAPLGTAFTLQSSEGAAVQFVITQDTREYPSDPLTTEDIQNEAPYLELADAEPIQLPEGIMGVAFTESQFPAYGSSTAHLWFAHNGNLYQVMADAKYAPLLRSIIHTLTFY